MEPKLLCGLQEKQSPSSPSSLFDRDDLFHMNKLGSRKWVCGVEGRGGGGGQDAGRGGGS